MSKIADITNRIRERKGLKLSVFGEVYPFLVSHQKMPSSSTSGPKSCVFNLYFSLSYLYANPDLSIFQGS